MIGLELIVKLKNMEFKDVANYLKISPQSVSDWIKGKRRIPPKRLEQLSEFFNIEEELINATLTKDDELRIHYKLSNEDMQYAGANKKSTKGDCKNMEQLKLNIDILEENERGKNEFTISDLEAQINKGRKTIKTEELKVMIDQLRYQYEVRNVIDIHPEYQRFFRWSPEQKSRFIESILIGIPIPPIFISEDKDLNWDVIDGVQRLSTIFEFLGILRDENNKLQPPTVLTKSEVLPALEGKVWNNEKYNKHNFCFVGNKFMENAFLNATIRVIKIDKESDPNAKYDIFDRLNTGGSRLTDQEVRNCLAIMLNRDFYIWLRNLSYNPDFIACLPISEKSIMKQDDLEYVLRFMVYRHIKDEDISPTSDIHKVLTDKMKEFCINKDLDYNREKEIFDKTFELLRISLGEDSFRKYDIKNNKFKGAVMLSSFEIIAIGIAHNLDKILKLENPVDYIKNKVVDLYNNEEYKELQNNKIASQRAVTRLRILTNFGKDYFEPNM